MNWWVSYKYHTDWSSITVMTADTAPHVVLDALVPARPGAPGRPKDMAKRAAILDAAKRLFTAEGYDGISMDQIAAEAGVSKLTVYSHFGDKESLFVAAVKSHCERQLPASLFAAEPDTAVEERLMAIAEAFFDMVSSPYAIAGHRMMCSPQLVGSKVTALFWEAGPGRVQKDFAELLERRIATGELHVPDTALAAEQFFTLLKGERHLRLVLDCPAASESSVKAHLRGAVDMFLRAYAAPAREFQPSAAARVRGK